MAMSMGHQIRSPSDPTYFYLNSDGLGWQMAWARDGLVKAQVIVFQTLENYKMRTLKNRLG